MSDEAIEEGIIVSTRSVMPFGGSRAVTLSAKWLDIQKWLGKELKELVSISSPNMVVYVEPDKKDEAIAFLRAWEARMREE